MTGKRLSRRFWIGLGLAAVSLAVLVRFSLSFDARNWPRLMLWAQGLRRIDDLATQGDARWADLRHLDLRQSRERLPFVGFNLRTRWPGPDKLPDGYHPGQVLTNAMNPGLGVRDLHRQGITGRGVGVAIVDFNVIGEHPEYARSLEAVHRLPGVESRYPSMHGPAVFSLLAGQHCGTAPGARVHFVATSDPGGDATEHAQAIDWILDQNRRLAEPERIRVISISAAPSGPALYPFRNGALYDAACQRAEDAGVLVIDATVGRGFIGPCCLDPAFPEDPSRCRPIPARGRRDYYRGRVLCPTSPRTTAEEYGPGPKLNGYQYCGIQTETHEAAGSSWSMPYASGVAALAWQVRPQLTPAEMREALRSTAHTLPTGERIIDPPALIARVRELNGNAPGPAGAVPSTSRSP